MECGNTVMNPPSSSSQADERVEWVRATMERHEAELLRYALSLVGDLPSAEDVVQDAFFKLCKQEPASLRGHLVPWLFTVVRNQALDRHRRESRWSRASEAEAAGMPGDSPSPSESVEARDDASHLRTMLATLPPNQREVVRLKFQNQMSYREISQLTRLTETNVGFLLHTAIKTLRRRFDRLDARPGSLTDPSASRP
jgi:RNA polymerase sigma-70 factor (ECF subfamily)